MFSPTDDNEFDRMVAFFVAVGTSQGHRALTMALIRNTVTPRQRPAVRAARLMVMRGSGRDRRQRVQWERQEFEQWVS